MPAWVAGPCVLVSDGRALDKVLVPSQLRRLVEAVAQVGDKGAPASQVLRHAGVCASFASGTSRSDAMLSGGRRRLPGRASEIVDDSPRVSVPLPPEPPPHEPVVPRIMAQRSRHRALALLLLPLAPTCSGWKM